MLYLLHSMLLEDVVIYLCALAVVLLLLFYFITRDKDLIYFAFAGISYFLGEICVDVISGPLNMPVDFIFYFFFYFFVLLFIRQRTSGLLKNPMDAGDAGWKTCILLSIDFFIVAIVSCLIYYYFDRVAVVPLYRIPPMNFPEVVDLFYPVLDFILLGYYVYISKVYIVSERKVYFPLCTGIIIWSVSDFLLFFEQAFKLKTHGFGDRLQILGLLIFIVVLVLMKGYKTDTYYTTININRDSSKYGEFNLLLNSLVVLYVAIYFICRQKYSDSFPLMDFVSESGIALLVLAVLRQNFINFEKQRRLNRISKDANTDPLTGLCTRKYAFTLMRSLFKSSLYFDLEMSALMLDIDYFKAFNDTYGHLSGDYALQDIARLINGSVENFSIVCRYGGEEFLIILPGADQAKGMQTAEKIRKSIESYRFIAGAGHSEVRVTVSIGGAGIGDGVRNEMDLLEKADDALYKAKKERNKCCWFSEDEPFPPKVEA